MHTINYEKNGIIGQIDSDVTLWSQIENEIDQLLKFE